MATKRVSITGGMASVLPPELIPEDQAASISNMRLGVDATWRAMYGMSEVSAAATVLTGITKIFPWEPAYLPAGCVDDQIFIGFTTAGACYAIYRTQKTPTDTWTRSAALKTGIITADIRTACDATQFVFVDGRTSNPAQRIIVDEEGTISCTIYGMATPTSAPEVMSIDASPISDENFTLVPTGSTLYYCYCVVNKWGERSNPSPVTVFDAHHKFVKGEYVINEYVYGTGHGGEIRGVQVSCAIDSPELAERVELYRAYANYTEGGEIISTPQLIRSTSVNGRSSVTFSDNVPASAQAVDDENDISPAGDDIALSGGVAFIGNAVSTVTFPSVVDKAWQITMTNNNTLNYSNQWVRVVLIDKPGSEVVTSQPYCENLDYSTAGIMTKLRFLDSDRTTQIEAYHYPEGTVLHDYVGDRSVKAIGMFLLRIPYIPATQEKVIYLVQESAALPAAQQIVELSAASDYMDSMLDNPVRNGGVMYAARMQDSDSICNYNPRALNRANSFNEFEPDEMVYNNTGYHTHFDGLALNHMQSAIAMFAYNEADMEMELVGVGEPSSLSGTDLTQPASYMLTNGGYACVAINFEFNTSGGAGDTPNKVLELGKNGDEEISILYFKAASTAYCILRLYHNGDKSYVAAAAALEDGMSWGPEAWLYISWGKSYNDGSGIVTPLCAAILQGQRNGTAVARPAWGFSDALYDYGVTPDDVFIEEPTTTSLRLYHTDEIADVYGVNGKLISPGPSGTPNHSIENFLGPCVVLGEYIDDPYEINALHLWEPHFPGEAVGWRGQTKTVGHTLYAVNSENVTIDMLPLTIDTSPGKIRWSRGGSVPELHERQTFEDVIRIAPLRSFMPTLEHNTLIIFTATGRMHRMVLDAENEISGIMVEREGMILASRDSLEVMGNGMVWHTQDAVWMMTESGIRDVSSYRVEHAASALIANPRENEILLLPTSGTVMRAYNFMNDTWTYRDHGITPIAYVWHDGEIHIIGASKLYKHSTAKLTGTIITRGHPARSRIRKITVRGTYFDDFTVQVRVYPPRVLTGYVTTPSYDARANVPLAIPNLSGDMVQFIIAGVDSLQYYDIEDTSGT